MSVWLDGRPARGRAVVVVVAILAMLAMLGAVLVPRGLAEPKPADASDQSNRDAKAAAQTDEAAPASRQTDRSEKARPETHRAAGATPQLGRASLIPGRRARARGSANKRVEDPGSDQAIDQQSQRTTNDQVEADAGDKAHRTFAGRPIEKARTITMEVTAYSPGPKSCGKWADGKTASGYSVRTNGGHLVAADTDLLPFGSIVSVPGYDNGEPVPVLDRGGAIQGKRLDVLYPTHQRALQWGRRTVEVTIWQYAD